ncbi:MAG: UDP-3-O-(3-hydroxymyristoyl)glucosamine N-acyltransferase [Desulfuromonadales bacterium]
MKLSLILNELSLDRQIEKDPEIAGISSLTDAQGTHLAYAIGDKEVEALRTTDAAAVLVTAELKDQIPDTAVAVVVDNPELAMAQATRLFAKSIELPDPDSRKIDPLAVIFPNVSLGSNVSVGKNSRIMSGVYLGDDVVVGDNSVVHPNSVVYHGCRIGSRCIVHANTVIGSDGFSYAHTKTGEHVKIEQMGNVIVEDDVEIGSNSSIDRATFKSTVIGRGAKIDNLVHISHNVIIGENSIIAGQTGIAGSTTLGRNVVMAAQSGATGHIHIADFSTIAGRGGVTKDTEPGKMYAGFPLMEHKTWLRLQAKLARILKSGK